MELVIQYHSRAYLCFHFSQVIDEIATAIRDTAGCTLLDVDAGVSTNRTVYTFVGEPAAVVHGALSAARTARRLINMAAHTGEGPALDRFIAVLMYQAGMLICFCVLHFVTVYNTTLHMNYLFEDTEPDGNVSA